MPIVGPIQKFYPQQNSFKEELVKLICTLVVTLFGVISNADQSRVLIVLSANTFFLSTADGSALFISEYPVHR